MFLMCPENVDKLCSMLCSSPMSTSISPNTQTGLLSCAGIDSRAALIAHKKASRFKRNRLAARVGTGDDHGVVSAAQCDVYRNDHSRIDERVARTHKTERMVVVHLRFHGLWSSASLALASSTSNSSIAP